MPGCICDSTASTPTGGGAGRGGGRTIPLSCGFSGRAPLSQVYSEVLLPWPPWPPGPPSSSDLGGLWLLFILSPVEFSRWAHSSMWAPGLQEAEAPGSVGVCVCLCVCLCPCEQGSPFGSVSCWDSGQCHPDRGAQGCVLQVHTLGGPVCSWVPLSQQVLGLQRPPFSLSAAASS